MTHIRVGEFWGWGVQVRTVDKSGNGEGPCVDLMIEEQRLKDTINCLLFTVEILTSPPALEKNHLNYYPQVNPTGQGGLSLCGYVNVSIPVGGCCRSAGLSLNLVCK